MANTKDENQKHNKKKKEMQTERRRKKTNWREIQERWLKQSRRDSKVNKKKEKTKIIIIISHEHNHDVQRDEN